MKSIQGIATLRHTIIRKVERTRAQQRRFNQSLRNAVRGYLKKDKALGVAVGASMAMVALFAANPASAQSVSGGTALNLGTTAVGTGAVASNPAIGGGGGVGPITNGSVAVGQASQATTQSATAVGYGAMALQDVGGLGVSGATAIGHQAKAQGDSTDPYNAASPTAVGNIAAALADGTIAFGEGAIANRYYSSAIGSYATASGIGSVATGGAAQATATGAIAIGGATSTGVATAPTGFAAASGNNSVAVGTSAAAIGQSAIALGLNASATSAASALATSGGALAIGSNSTAIAGVGGSSMAIGPGATAKSNTTGGDSLAIGAGAQATAQDSTAIGGQSIASAVNTIAIGNNTTQATAANATALGVDAQASGAGAIAVGSNGTAGAHATAANAIAIGGQSVASSSLSVALGQNAIASNNSTVAIGANSTASGANGAIAIGNAQATNTGSIAMGSIGSFGGIAKATGLDAMALGNGSTASAQAATAVGVSSSAVGVSASAFGVGAAANNVNDTAVGSGSVAGTVANSRNTAIGVSAKATGGSSFAGGAGANASAVGATAIGGNATAGAVASAADAIAIGGQSTATSAGAVAIGLQATAKGGKAVSIGVGNVAFGNGAVSIGDPNYASGTGSVALGADNIANSDGTPTATALNAANGSVAIGNANIAVGPGSVALGQNSVTKVAGSIAIGDTALASASKGIALGSGAIAMFANDVALGSSSVTSAPHVGTTALYGGTAAGAANAVVSVGVAGGERQITNVAPGVISATSTDAINGSQLNSVKIGVDALGTATAANLGGGAAYDPLTGKVSAPAYAVGSGSYNNVDSALTALQTGAPVQYATAGAPTTANGLIASNNVTLVGKTAGGVVLDNVAPGSTVAGSTQAINGGQLNTGLASVATNLGGGAVFNPVTGQVTPPSYAIGGTTYTDVGSALGALAASSGKTKYFNANSTLADSSATGTDSVAIGPNAVANNKNDVALGSGSVTAAPNVGAYSVNGGTAAGTAPTSVVSVGSAGSERQITNVAAGVVSATSTDAVNGSQLFIVGTAVNAVGTTVAANLGGGAVYDPLTGKVSAPSYTVGSSNLGDVGSALAALQTGSPIQYATVGTPTTANGLVPSQNVTLVGAAAGPVTLDNVAPGSTVAGSTQAINGGQLNTSLASVATNLGGGSTFDPVTGKVTAPSITIAGKAYSDVTSAIQAAGGGFNVTTAKTGSGVANGTSVANVAPGVTATVAAGNNVITTQSGSTIEVAVNPVLTGLTSVGITGGPTLDATGIKLAAGNTLDMGGNKITNLAAGSTATGSTEAINGGQFNSGLGSLATDLGGGAKYDPVTGKVTAPSYSIAGATYADVGSALGALANGGAKTKYFNANSVLADSQAIGTNAVAVGPNAQAAGNNAIASGANSQAAGNLASAYGSNANAVGTNSTALGANASANNTGDVALGANSATAAANKGAYTVNGGTAAATAPVSVVSVGDTGKERQITNVAAGVISATSTDAVNGSQLFIVGTAVNAVGTTVAANLGGGAAYDPLTGKVSAPAYAVGSSSYNNVGSALAAVQTGAPVQYSTAGTPTTANGLVASNNMTLVGKTAGGVVLDNVAPGSTVAGSTQAINGGQLNTGLASVATNLGGGSTFDPVTGKVTAPSYTIGGTAFGNVGSALGAVDTAVTSLTNGTSGLVQQVGGAPGSGQIVVASTTGGSSVSFTGTAGDRTLTGVAAGAITAVSRDAVNGSQVYANQASVVAALGGSAKVNPDGTVAAPNYTIGSTAYNNVGSALGALDASVNGGAGIKYFHTNSTLGDATATGADSVAIGALAVATNTGDVALGSNSVTATPNMGAYSVNGGTVAAAASRSVVSVGSAGSERQITNVAAGVVSATSTDAVNGSQLFIVGTAVNAVGTTIAANLGGGAVYDPLTGKVSAPSYTVGSSNLGDVGSALAALQTGSPIQYATAGTPTTANGLVPSQNVTLVGAAAGPVTLDNVAPGSTVAGSTQAINGGQLNTGLASVATNIGGGSTFDPVTGTVTAPSYTVAGANYANVGSALGAVDASLTNLANGTSGLVQQVGGAPGTGALTVGAATSGTSMNIAGTAGDRTLTGVAAGTIAAASNDAVNGSQVFANQASVASALGGGAKVNPDGTIAAPSYTVGASTVADVGSAIAALQSGSPVQYSTARAPTTANGLVPSNNMTLVGAAAGPVTLDNLAAGSTFAGSTQAINGGQLNNGLASVATSLGGGSVYDFVSGKVTAPSFTIGATAYNDVGSALSAVNLAVAGGAGVKYFHTNSALADSAPLGTDAVAIGPVGTAAGTASIAAGKNAQATGVSSIAMGDGASATTDGAIAIGKNASALGGKATAIGVGNIANGDGAVAIGDPNVATGIGAVALGKDNTATGTGAVALGNTNLAIGQGAVAIGSNSTANAAGAIALGDTAVATNKNDVALGSGSVTAAPNTGAYTVNGGTVAGTAPTSVVSVGSAGNERQITNLAAGVVSATSTDAINGSQLYVVGTAVNTVGTTVAANLGGGAAYDPLTGKVSAPAYAVGSGSYNNVGSALAALQTGSPIQYATAGAPTTANGLVPSQNVTLVGAAAGPVTLDNVAPGSTIAGSTQAINGGQLNTGLASVATNLGGGSTYDPVTGKVTAPAYNIGATSYSDVGSALASIDKSVNGGAGIKYFHANSGLADSLASGTDSVAIGPNAKATAAGSIALGAGSDASRGAVTAVLDPLSLTGGTVTTTVGELSVGSVATPRQITNVAAGTQVTDAVNVGQIVPLITAQKQLGITTAANFGGGAMYDPTTGKMTAPNYTVGGTIYTNTGSAIAALDKSIGSAIATNNASNLANPVASGADATAISPGAVASGIDAIAVGKNSLASGAQATAMGTSAQATGAQSVAIGNGAVASATSTTALGDNAKATAADATALGQNTLASGLNSTATGYGARATGDKSLASGNGALASGTSAVALGDAALATGKNSVALGANSTDGGQANVVSIGSVGAERKLVNVAAGAVSATSTDAVNGQQLNTTNLQVAALDHKTVQYATGAGGSTLSEISLSSDAGGPVVIHNLAAGVTATDAANLGQVNAVAAVANNSAQYDKTTSGGKGNSITFQGGTAGAPVALRNVAAGVAATDAVNLGQMLRGQDATLAAANSYTDKQVSNLAAFTAKGIKEAKQMAISGTAVALAGTGLRYDDRPGKTSVSGATSFYKGEMGLAFGIGHTSQDQVWRTNLSVNGTPFADKPEIGVVVGATFTFN